jgi:peptide-methionine (S)-S-oxide reductase
MDTLRRFVALLAGIASLAAGVPAGAQAPPKTEQAVLAGGCFWGTEAVFEHLRGVTSVVSGFSGGTAATAHYEAVETGKTGQAESVQITYDPSVISYKQLLQVFFTVAHDPTEVNRQGPDEGPQYRSVIFYADDAQKQTAQATIAALTAAHTFSAPIVTEVVPLHGFFPAEAYHQHFAERHPDNPYIVQNDLPKLDYLKKRFPDLVKSA